MSAVRPDAAILAGGRARRFGGRDKSRLIVDGAPIIVRQVEILQRVAGHVFIVANIPERFAELGLPVYPDVVPGAGAIGGILTAIERAVVEPVLVVACDLPYLDAGLLQRLTELAAGADGAWVHGPRGVEPLLACYRRSAGPAIRAAIEGGRLKAADLGAVLHMAELDASELARFGPAERLLANINAPEDYARIELPRPS